MKSLHTESNTERKPNPGIKMLFYAKILHIIHKTLWNPIYFIYLILYKTHNKTSSRDVREGWEDGSAYSMILRGLFIPVGRGASPNKRKRFPHEACCSCAGVWRLRPEALPDGFVEAHVKGGHKYLRAIPRGNKNCVRYGQK